MQDRRKLSRWCIKMKSAFVDYFAGRDNFRKERGGCGVFVFCGRVTDGLYGLLQRICCFAQKFLPFQQGFALEGRRDDRNVYIAVRPGFPGCVRAKEDNLLDRDIHIFQAVDQAFGYEFNFCSRFNHFKNPLVCFKYFSATLRLYSLAIFDMSSG